MKRQVCLSFVPWAFALLWCVPGAIAFEVLVPAPSQWLSATFGIVLWATGYIVGWMGVARFEGLI